MCDLASARNYGKICATIYWKWRAYMCEQHARICQINMRQYVLNVQGYVLCVMTIIVINQYVFCRLSTCYYGLWWITMHYYHLPCTIMCYLEELLAGQRMETYNSNSSFTFHGLTAEQWTTAGWILTLDKRMSHVWLSLNMWYVVHFWTTKDKQWTAVFDSCQTTSA